MNFPKNGPMLKIEDVIPRTEYTFTLNPNDDYQFNKSSSLQRLKNFRSINDNRIRHFLGPFTRYTLHLEVSPIGRLHYHGVIQFDGLPEIRDFYLSLPKLRQYCIFEMDSIESPEIWEKYCTKQEAIFPGCTISESPLDDTPNVISDWFKKKDEQNDDL